MRIMNKHETKEISSVNLPTINYSVVRKTDCGFQMMMH